MSNAMSLKAKIRNIAKRKNIPAQVILQNYMFERLLVRLAASTYDERAKLKKEAWIIDTLKANVDDFLKPVSEREQEQKRNNQIE